VFTDVIDGNGSDVPAAVTGRPIRGHSFVS